LVAKILHTLWVARYTLSLKQISINIKFRLVGKLQLLLYILNCVRFEGKPCITWCGGACVGPFSFAPSERVYVCVPPAGMNYSQPHAAVAAALSQITATHMQTKPEHARCFLTQPKEATAHASASAAGSSTSSERKARERTFQITPCLAVPSHSAVGCFTKK
jgi:hypothetical protein